MTVYNIPEATGASIRPGDLIKETVFSVTDFGASVTAAPADNTRAINAAISAAAQKGGTVLIPRGTFYTYTILLQSNVNLCLEEGAIIAAAKTDITHFYAKQEGEGGNYEEPEVNLYAGIQDHGHSYFANSLVYGADLENIMIYGKGLFTGGRFQAESGILEYVLQGGDPEEPSFRNQKGHAGEWFGNKGIALVRCKNIVLEDFSFTIGGHFAIITEACENLYVNHVLVDTTRDAFDIDCCQDVTVRHTTCNSLTDDGLCLKASFGAGCFKPVQNVLIEDCIVSGYDAGSVYAGEYTRDKLIATDRCGPTGRVKFGTESTCGYHLVTIRRVKFDRSRGFCMEAVDCSSLTDVIFEDCELDNVSSSPIFLRAGDRARFPVTGKNTSSEYPVSGSDVRLDNKNWILPKENSYHCYPVRRYSPCYNRTKTVTVDGHSFFEIIDDTDPVQCNPANYVEEDEQFYLNTWKSNNTVQLLPANGSYEADPAHELAERDLPLYANGIGCSDLASVENVLIRNVTITNADPRYPILLMGLTDSHIKNVTLENISVEYRGGLTMEHAVEQRQLNTEWKYSQFHAGEQVQNLPWLVNTFFLKNEGLLPRMDWDRDKECWREDAYNIPELPDVYPEPSNWGILPAYGFFARHVDGLVLRNIKFSCKVPDGRHVCVLDDVNGFSVDGLEAYCGKDIPPIAVVTNHYRRHTNAENVPEQPYFTTDVTGLEIVKPLVLHRSCPVAAGNTHSSAYDSHAQIRIEDSPAQSAVNDTQAQSVINGNRMHSPIIRKIEIQAPAPGTPQDSLYPYPTVPCQESGYHFAVDTDDYPLPLTVHRPFIQSIAPVCVKPGEVCSLVLTVRNPASDISDEADNGMIYNEPSKRPNYSVKGREIPLTLSCETIPPGASFYPEQRKFLWTPTEAQLGEHFITFVVDDGVIPEKMTVKIGVKI